MVKIAVVGGESLLGREVRELLEEARFPADVHLFSAEEMTGILTKQRDEAVILPPLTAADLIATGIVILTGSVESGAKVLRLTAQVHPSPVIIDVCGGLEDHPEARLRAPLVESPDTIPAGSVTQVIAHPAAIALALFLKRLHKISPVRRSVVLIFEPASERGQAGLDELQQQTVGLLSFKKINKDVFDAQLSFNMLIRYGSDAPKSLEEIELRIDRHLASLLAGAIPMPSLRLVQVPVFHGYSMSLWVEFENNPGPQALAAGLASTDIDVRTEDEEAPSNVGVAGQSGITVGEMSTDRNDSRACWFWLAADNLRIAAGNAVEAARAALE